MVWIVETEDGNTQEVKDDSIGYFVSHNKVVKCRLKK